MPYKQLTGVKNIQFQEGLPETFGNTRGKPSLLILDDLLNQVYSEAVCDLFTEGSHHRNVSVILVTQNLFHQGPKCRDISLNAKYVVALKNVRDRNQFSFLARQAYPENSDSLYRTYLDSPSRPHGYLILDFSQDTDDRVRFRTNVFPDERPAVIYAPVNDKADTIELSRTTRVKKRES